jgi:hypothetical protein
MGGSYGHFPLGAAEELLDEFTVNTLLASELPVYGHDHRKEDHQAKNTHDDPAHHLLDFVFALCGFKLSLHFSPPLLGLPFGRGLSFNPMPRHTLLPKNPADNEENHCQCAKDNTLESESHDGLPPLYCY